MTEMMQPKKKNANYEGLGGCVTAKTIYRRLKTTKKATGSNELSRLESPEWHF